MKYLFIIFISSLTTISCDQKEKSPVVVEERKLDTPATKETTHVGDTANLDFWQKKALQGIDFVATGNEPFWSLEMDLEKSMHFKSIEGFEIITPVPTPVKAMYSDVSRYHAETEQGTLTVQIGKLECINDMSGERSDYTVTISTKNKTDKDYKTYKGCGRYLSIKKPSV